MIGIIFGKAMWVGRATVFLVGLAVILALTVGLASTALAGAGIGARLDLGKVNTVDAITTLVGSVAGPSLKVDNNSTVSGATALDLRVEPNKDPMKVNSSAKVENLNVDKLDGKDSADFLAADGKAVDAARAGFADFAGTAQNAQVAAEANDADKLDGLDSTQIGINGYVNIRKESAFDSSSAKAFFVDCPQGTEVLGGGASVFPSNADPNQFNAPIALRSNGPDINGLEAWSATALEVEPYPFEWRLTVRVICADVGNP